MAVYGMEGCKRLMIDVFGIQEDDILTSLTEGNIPLPVRIEEVIRTLPAMKGLRDDAAWARYRRLLEYRFGLVEGSSPMHPSEIIQMTEFQNIGTGQLYNIRARAMRMLQHPHRSRQLTGFISK